MRAITSIQNPQPLKRTQKADSALGAYLMLELKDATSARYPEEMLWRECLRQYEAVPRVATRKLPYEGSPNIEIPLGAIAADSVVAQVTDLIFTASPPIMVRASAGYEDNAPAFQNLIIKMLADDFINIRRTIYTVVADTVKLGTGCYYIPNVKQVVKTGLDLVKSEGPRWYSIPPEDLIVPGGAEEDVQAIRWVSYRHYYTAGELTDLAKTMGWDIGDVKTVANVSWVRTRREDLARTREPQDATINLYEIHEVYMRYDYDDDGFDEDMLVTFDNVTFKVLDVKYCPFTRRPFVVSRYQLREHMFYGMGVLEMCRPFQDEVTEWHNFRMANAQLANLRVWAYKLGSPLGDKIRVAPGKPLGLTDPATDLKPLVMADVYPSAIQYEASTIALAERRVGTNELGLPLRGSSGSRTPGITALSLLQAQNRRFSQPFNQIRDAIAEAFNMSLVRLQEQVQLGNQSVIKDIVRMVGPKDAVLIMEVLQGSTRDIEDSVVIEVTAASTSINRDADKQNSMMLAQALNTYYQQTIQLAQFMQQPQPPPMKKLLGNIAKATNKAVERLLRTFDTVRDPSIFIPMDEALINELANAGMAQGGLAGLGNAISGTEGPQGGAGQPPGAGGPQPGGGPQGGGPGA